MNPLASLASFSSVATIALATLALTSSTLAQGMSAPLIGGGAAQMGPMGMSANLAGGGIATNGPMGMSAGLVGGGGVQMGGPSYGFSPSFTGPRCVFQCRNAGGFESPFIVPQVGYAQRLCNSLGGTHFEIPGRDYGSIWRDPGLDCHSMPGGAYGPAMGFCGVGINPVGLACGRLNSAGFPFRSCSPMGVFPGLPPMPGNLLGRPNYRSLYPMSPASAY